MQLQQRLASNSQASCCSAARPLVVRPRRSTAPAAPLKHSKQCKRPILQVCHVAELDQVDDEDELEEDPSQAEMDNPYDRMVDINNVYPDYEDEEWVSRVTNWEEFWYGSEDVLDLDDDDGDVSAADQSMLAYNRAHSLIQQLGSLRKRTDVEQMIGPRVRPPETYDQSYTNAFQYADEMPMERIDPNPDWNVMDMRALAEKRRHRCARAQAAAGCSSRSTLAAAGCCSKSTLAAAACSGGSAEAAAGHSSGLAQAAACCSSGSC
eukprot:GHRQ01022955.1.p1 GENE.GHRQ01022955.1~~GHRQ01022955.1.p1  ORF type:complete len:265 (+),score=96.00 GHRQ01022955.1:162-956(+)